MKHRHYWKLVVVEHYVGSPELYYVCRCGRERAHKPTTQKYAKPAEGASVSVLRPNGRKEA